MQPGGGRKMKKKIVEVFYVHRGCFENDQSVVHVLEN
jgi:hypothetical protein